MTTMRRAFAAAALMGAGLLAAVPAVSQKAGEIAEPRVPELKYQTYTLPNGLKVITHEDHRLPLIAVDLWYHVGAVNERPGRTGFAHLFEHMMFEGSEHIGEKSQGKGHINYVEAAGASDVNGTTDFDRTNYFETLPSNQLELALWLESDRMGFLMEGLNREKLINQKDVVRNERRQHEGTPYDAAAEQVYHLLFPKEHPYYGEVIGSHADIEAARIADVRDFHQQFYTPNNASIAIAGDFDPAQLKAMLTKYFGPIPKGPAVPAVSVTTPPITSQRRATVTDTVQLPQLEIAWLGPKVFTPESYDLDTAMFALGQGKASRLYQALVYKTQVAQGVSCNIESLEVTGIAECTVTAKPGVKLEDLEATVWSELAKLQATGPTTDEVAANRAANLTGKISGLQRLGGFGGIADTLDMYNHFTGDPGFLPKDVAMMEAVTPARAKAALNKLTKDNAVVVYCVPGEKKTEDVPRSPADTDANVKLTDPYTPAFEASQQWRNTVPQPGPQPAFHLPVPQTFTLANGVKVYVIEDHGLPIFSASVVLRAGSETVPPAKAGLASLTALLMSDGTESRDLTKLQQDEDRIGVSITPSSGVDAAGAGVGGLVAYAPTAMTLLADVLEHPGFRAEDFDRRQKTRLISIQQQADSVEAMAFRVGPHLLFGDSPYGTPQSGTIDSVKAITRDDIVGFYRQHYGPADAALIFAGDLTLADARRLAEEHFGRWTGTASAAVTLPPAPAPQPTHVVIVDKPGAPQTALFALGLGVPANSPEMPTLDIANYTLGGSFGSRINNNLREVHGYTYGANSQFSGYRTAGLFLAGGLVRTDVTAPAAQEMLKEIRNFPSHPSTDAELAAAKRSYIQSLPGEFETAGAIAGSVSSIFVFNRPLDYYSTLPAKFAAVSASDVARITQQDLHPDQLIIVAAGDRAKIEPALKDAGLGPVEVRDINGDLVK